MELLAAEQTLENRDWFQGTADAVRKHLTHYHLKPADWVLILAGDHIYRMNYRTIFNFHEEKKADLTIGTVPVTKREIGQFGIMRLRSDERIVAFKEKPTPKENIHGFAVPENVRRQFHLKEKREFYLASMGVYVFRAEVLIDLLKGKEADFGRELIPKAIEMVKSYGYVFDGYWRDIGTIRNFYEANIELTRENPPFTFFDPRDRVFTRPRFLPPCGVFGSRLKNVLLSEGCVLKGVSVENSVVGLRSVIREGSVIRKSVLMGADFYQSEELEAGRPDLGVGKNCVIENTIVDKNARIGNNVIIRNHKKVREIDGENYYIRDGIVIIARGARIPDGTEI